MSNKTKALYDAVLDRLREIMETIPGTGFQIELFVSEFESAIQSAMERAFPGARAVGCWFHFGHPASTATFHGRSLNVQIGSLAVEFGRWLDVQRTSKCRVNRRRNFDVQFST